MNRSDNFDRTAGVGVMESAPGWAPSDGGSAWTIADDGANGTWSIDASGYAYDADSSGNTQRILLLDSGAADFELSCQIPYVGGDGGFMFRCSGYNLTGWLLAIRRTNSSKVSLYRWSNVSGNLETVFNSTLAVSDGQTVKIRCVGTSIEIYYDAVLKHSVTSSYQQTGTYHGIRNYSLSTDFRWDNFSITDLSSTAASRRQRGIVTGGSLGRGIKTGGCL